MEGLAVIILAAGKGSRMKSDLAKVLHPVAGKSMVNHVIAAATLFAPDHIHVVVGHQAEQVKQDILACHRVHFALQKQLLGTGDAVKAALPDLSDDISNVLVLCGDVPLIKPETIGRLVNLHSASASSLTVLAVQVQDPAGYGRIIQDTCGNLLAIREETDANEQEKNVKIVNSGIFCFQRSFLEEGICLIQNNNSQREYYLTDLVEIAVKKNVQTSVFTSEDEDQVMGVNTLSHLEKAQELFKSQVR